MLIKKLLIHGLFGHFNHTIDFREENITIITAPNGYGKTICLKIIDAIFNRKLSFLADLQFSKIIVETTEGTLKIAKDDVESNDSLSLNFHKHEQGGTYEQYDSYSFSKRHSIRDIDTHIPFLHRVGAREWMDHRTDEIVDFDEIVELYDEYLPTEFTTKNYPEWFNAFTNSLNAHFIKDQRLIQRKNVSSNRFKQDNFTDTIEKYADELSELIKQSGFQASYVSQQLDTTFPERLLRKNINLVFMEVEQLKSELERLQKIRTDLSKFDLLSTEQHLPALDILNEIKDEDAKVLTLYVQDTKEKLSSYEDIYKKIELFSRILNKKRLSFKKIRINAEKGFLFETDDKKPLKLTQLSSGEQHQVVLLYELIFKTEKNILVLIDEPEISLHVAWQKEFLSDLQEIIQIQNMPVVIATHSPQIIGGRWELTVDLGVGAKE